MSADFLPLINMNRLYLLLGVVVLAVGIIDLLWTTLWIEGGAGPLTSRLMSWAWKILRWIGNSNSWIRSLTGPFIFAISLLAWIILLWGGWTLIFSGAERALIDTLSRGSISWMDRIYFTGYTIFTLGNGDFAPQDGGWQFITVLTTASGMLFVTLSVTYILSVLDAVTQKRSFAIGVSGLGTRGTSIVRSSWNGEEFQGLDLLLNTYTEQLNTLTMNHKAYPILHYFHSTQTEHAPTVAIAALDEALTLIEFGVQEQKQPDDIITQTARSSVRSYLETLQSAFIEPAEQAPPSPNLDALRDADVPTVSDEEFATALNDLADRRRTILGLVESDARNWPASHEDD